MVFKAQVTIFVQIKALRWSCMLLHLHAPVFYTRWAFLHARSKHDPATLLQQRPTGPSTLCKAKGLVICHMPCRLQTDTRAGHCSFRHTEQGDNM